MSNRPMPAGRHGAPAGPMPKMGFASLGRILKMLFRFYPVLLPVTMGCIVISAVVSSIPSIFTKNVLEIVTRYLEAGSTDWSAAAGEILPLIAILAVLYVLSIAFITIYTQLMCVITQGYLDKMRRRMFDGMQNLPVRYFDTHKHGDIMSHYTNDIDTLRQLISQSMPQMLNSLVIVVSVLSIMLWYSVWMTLIILTGVVAMFFVSRIAGGGSAKYFMRQQKSTGAVEGYVQEMMNGQKVIKVFCHEKEAEAGSIIIFLNINFY